MRISLGEPLRKRLGSLTNVWPVLRDGEDSGTFVLGTGRGYRFEVPHTMTDDGLPYQGPSRMFRQDAHADADKWFNGNKGEGK